MHPFCQEPDCKSCHVSMSHPLLLVQEKLKIIPLLVVLEKLKTFNVGQTFGECILLGIWDIHLARNQIVRAAIFLHLARSPLPVVQEKLQTFNVGQAFGISISPGIWGIHLAGNQIVRVAMFPHYAIPQGDIHLAGNQIARVAMFLCHARSPLPVLQEKPLLVVHEKKLKGIQGWPSIWSIHFMGNYGYPFGWEPDSESCHVSMSSNVNSISSSGKVKDVTSAGSSGIA